MSPQAPAPGPRASQRSLQGPGGGHRPVTWLLGSSGLLLPFPLARPWRGANILPAVPSRNLGWWRVCAGHWVQLPGAWLGGQGEQGEGGGREEHGGEAARRQPGRGLQWAGKRAGDGSQPCTQAGCGGPGAPRQEGAAPSPPASNIQHASDTQPSLPQVDGAGDQLLHYTREQEAQQRCQGGRGPVRPERQGSRLSSSFPPRPPRLSLPARSLRRVPATPPVALGLGAAGAHGAGASAQQPAWGGGGVSACAARPPVSTTTCTWRLRWGRSRPLPAAGTFSTADQTETLQRRLGSCTAVRIRGPPAWEGVGGPYPGPALAIRPENGAQGTRTGEEEVKPPLFLGAWSSAQKVLKTPPTNR